ncbi:MULTISPECIES: MlaD family protein [Gordonia]|uniref:MlaD family protein n=1 Tax=Gordonia TaxID=2053 RepID=UPI0009EE6CF3|nr:MULTISPECIES: MlaD family protein [unclassified Gordonia (in: high G+C Gram-positive bacteria)]
MQRLTRLVPRRMVAPLLRFIAAAVVAALLFVLIQNAIKNPTESPTNGVSADFTDVSGLRPNADVRVRGVRVGKVTDVQLSQSGTRSSATVDFTIDSSHHLTDRSRVAVKYANLSGVRYLDVIDGEGSGRRVDHVPADRTVPSFDITTLFNGLQPALRTLSPADINTFTSNALTLLQGDGSGLKPLLASVDKLSRYATDRQQVVSTLVANLSRISDTLGGKSPQIIEFLRDVERPIDSAMSVLDEFEKADRYGPKLMGNINQILAGLGIEPTTDIDALLSEAFPSIDNLQKSMGLLPTVAAAMQSASAAPAADRQCSRGQAELPGIVRVLMNGSGVVVCNAG